MENSMNSMNKPLISTCDDGSYSEESGWTMYFEDFFNNKANHGIDDQEEEHSCCPSSDFGSSSSIVSDAASSAVAGKLAGTGDDQQQNLFVVGSSKRLSFKKRRRIKEANFVDYDLEDTASSSAYNPKVCNLLNHNKDPKQVDTMNTSQVRQDRFSGQIEERHHEIRFSGRDDDDDGVRLKKRGLCLVPLSMLVNFLG